MIYSDKKIIEWVIHGGEKQEKVLFHLYKSINKKVIHLIKQKGGTKEDALDVLQEAITIFWEKVYKGQITPQSKINVSAYIIRICSNKWIDNIRKKHPEKEVRIEERILKEKASVFSDAEFNLEQERMLEQLLDKTGEKCKKIIIHMLLYDWSANEIADYLGYANARTVIAQKYRCMQRLFELAQKAKNKYLKIV